MNRSDGVAQHAVGRLPQDTREVVRRAIHRGGPDRMPLVYRTDAQRSDIVTLGYGPPTGWQPAHVGEDEWGLRWAKLINTGLGQVVAEPLAAQADLSTYRFPDPQAPGRFAGFEAARPKHTGKYIAGGMGLSGFTIMMLLRGLENLFCDLHQDPAFVSALAERVFAFEAEIIAEYARRGADGLWFFDDLGTEHGLLIHPATWRRVFKPRYCAEFRLAHALGLDVFFHSCGDIWDVIPDLIEIGVDVLNVEQPLVFGQEGQDGIERLAQHFAGRVCFCTNVDSQRTLIAGSPAEIEAEAAHIVRALGQPAGGLIPLADCGRDHGIVPAGHVECMSAAFERWAKVDAG